MKENKYEDDAFFAEYSKMSRSVDGLAGAGEWHAFRKLMPDFSGKRVLDLGCGFGWHCAYALEHGAQSVVGVDLSHKMLSRAKEMVRSPKVQFIQTSIEDYPYPKEAFDVVVRSWPSTMSPILRISAARSMTPWLPAESLSSRWSTPSSPPMAPRIGTGMGRGTSSTGRWTATSLRACAMRCS